MQANFAEAPTAQLYFFILPGDGHAAKWVRGGASCLFAAATELCPQDSTQPRVKAVECIPQKPRRKNWHGAFNLHSCKMKSVRWDNELHILWTILSLSQNKVQGQGWRGGGVEGWRKDVSLGDKMAWLTHPCFHSNDPSPCTSPSVIL